VRNGGAGDLLTVCGLPLQREVICLILQSDCGSPGSSEIRMSIKRVGSGPLVIWPRLPTASMPSINGARVAPITNEFTTTTTVRDAK
jgi:hypothetical protein